MPVAHPTVEEGYRLRVMVGRRYGQVVGQLHGRSSSLFHLKPPLQNETNQNKQAVWCWLGKVTVVPENSEMGTKT